MTTMKAGAVPTWTVGDRLRKAREMVGLDRQAFAVEVGSSRNTIAKYETGDKDVPRTLLLAWSMRTGVSMEWITGETGGPGGGEGMSTTNPCFSVVRGFVTSRATLATSVAAA